MRTISILIASVAVTAFACGSEPAQPVTPTPTVTAVAPADVPSAVPTAEPEASASAAVDAGPPPKASSGRPPILKTDPQEITDTFGYSPAAKLEIGEKDFAIFKIPENALTRATNVTFKLDPKGKSLGPPIGKIYRLTAIIPPNQEANPITTNGPPFELTLPAGAKKDANLAIGEVVSDGKGHDKLVWKVVAPVKIDDSTNSARFELQTISDMWLHVTTKPPTDAK